MTYPDGTTLDYNYDAGTDASISRLSSMSNDETGLLQSYTYQGLDPRLGMTDGNGVTETITEDRMDAE